MGYTTLASGLSFEQGILLSWYDAEREKQFVQWAREAYASSTEDVDKLFDSTDTAAQLQTHMQTMLTDDLTTSSNPPHTQAPSDPLQDLHTSASPHTQTQPVPTEDLHTSGASAQVLSSGIFAHTHTRPEPTGDLNTSSNPQTHAQPEVGGLTLVPIALPTFLNLVHSLEGSRVQPECVFVDTQMTGFRFKINNAEAGFWRMTGGLQTFSQTGMFGLMMPNKTS